MSKYKNAKKKYKKTAAPQDNKMQNEKTNLPCYRMDPLN